MGWLAGRSAWYWRQPAAEAGQNRGAIIRRRGRTPLPPQPDQYSQAQQRGNIEGFTEILAGGVVDDIEIDIAVFDTAALIESDMAAVHRQRRFAAVETQMPVRPAAAYHQ